MRIIGGPHDGGHEWNPQPGQIGLVLSISPGRPHPMPRCDDYPGDPGAYYSVRNGAYVFTSWVDRTATPAQWEVLTYGEEAAA